VVGARQRVVRFVHEERILEPIPPTDLSSTLLITDTSGVTKRYAEKMEYLGGARDGSENRIGKG